MSRGKSITRGAAAVEGVPEGGAGGRVSNPMPTSYMLSPNVVHVTREIHHEGGSSGGGRKSITRGAAAVEGVPEGGAGGRVSNPMPTSYMLSPNVVHVTREIHHEGGSSGGGRKSITRGAAAVEGVPEGGAGGRVSNPMPTSYMLSPNVVHVTREIHHEGGSSGGGRKSITRGAAAVEGVPEGGAGGRVSNPMPTSYMLSPNVVHVTREIHHEGGSSGGGRKSITRGAAAVEGVPEGGAGGRVSNPMPTSYMLSPNVVHVTREIHHEGGSSGGGRKSITRGAAAVEGVPEGGAGGRVSNPMPTSYMLSPNVGNPSRGGQQRWRAYQREGPVAVFPTPCQLLTCSLLMWCMSRGKSITRGAAAVEGIPEGGAGGRVSNPMPTSYMLSPNVVHVTREIHHEGGSSGGGRTRGRGRWPCFQPHANFLHALPSVVHVVQASAALRSAGKPSRGAAAVEGEPEGLVEATAEAIKQEYRFKRPELLKPVVEPTLAKLVL
ncbi:unnamed protein product [Closterium sp. Naga37s-1]|nr:unnamed protein product [Closterium sp. Naga37s-1]